MIKDSIGQYLNAALEKAGPSINNINQEPSVLDALRIERPRNPEHGDYAVNISPLARYAKMAPPQIAAAIHQNLPDGEVETAIIAGFINFKVSDALLSEALLKIVRDEKPGLNESQKELKALIEFVSANPTGPLHIGHGRWAALGDSIRRVLEHCGAKVTSEFYINDAGVQMNNLAQSLWWRCLEMVDASKSFPQKVGDEPYPYYPGDYLIDLAKEFLAIPENKAAFVSLWTREQSFPEDATPAFKSFLKESLTPFAKHRILGQQQDLLKRLGVPFEVWFFEEAELHNTDRLANTLRALEEGGHIYEEDGALWFKSSAFGDEKDRVLKKSNGFYTYLTADIAYHHEKFTRKSEDGSAAYNKIINIWGADHHGYMARMRAAIQALGHDINQFEILLGQLVNLIVDGEKTRMGKRRKMLTLEDVMEEVGVDATRFWMVSKSADTTLDFDVDLAASATDENPVFYVQYAHARCSGILRNATQGGVNVNTGEEVPPTLSAGEWEEFLKNLGPASLQPLFSGLESDRATETLKALIIRLDAFEDLIKDAAVLRAPHIIARYALDLSADFHSFYNVCRVLTPNKALTQARLTLIVAIQKTLAQALHLLGVSAPEKM